MSGLSLPALRELRDASAALAELPDDIRYSKAVEFVVAYFQDPRQLEGRQGASDDEGASPQRIYEFRANWIMDSAPELDEPATSWLQELLNDARNDRLAYESVRPVIAALVSCNVMNGALREFIADDYAEKIKPRAKTRRRSPREWLKQEQLAQAVFALLAAKAAKTDHEAHRIVADAADAADFEPPKSAMLRDDRINRIEHVRTATKHSKKGIIGRITGT